MTKEQIQVMNGIANILRKKQSKQSATVNLMPKKLPTKKNLWRR
jgi:homoserine trans-succinylase